MSLEMHHFWHIDEGDGHSCELCDVLLHSPSVSADLPPLDIHPVEVYPGINYNVAFGYISSDFQRNPVLSFLSRPPPISIRVLS